MVKDVRNQTCPKCMAKLDGLTSLEGVERPSRGDITVCLYCKEILVFSKNLCLKRATADEISEIDFIQPQKIYAFIEKFNGVKNDLRGSSPENKP